MGNISSQIQPSEVFRPFNLFILFVTLYGVETARKFTNARAALARVGNMLGPRAIFGPYSLLGNILPPIPYVKLSSEIHFGEKYAFHQKYGCDVIADGYIFDTNQVYLRIADAAVVKQRLARVAIDNEQNRISEATQDVQVYFIIRDQRGDYNRDAFIPFAAGPRACIGRRFSEVEAVTFLAHLILRYRFEPTPMRDGETFEERKERVLRWHQGSITLAPQKVPLMFSRR
ncbi:hypothetical protein M408DRAFT_9898 [Serendipita vermifera MAFF 305830]|uniref:Cytochrome P450 n=1 Tax=Serendipita vermifera MAFF 305830 TaxID=933852 RepID=A0A0C2XBD3_SERVB|nr:hypothetical protein M408DRAFT_9898 [Serendipita vermifera MAFF 305830]